MIPAGDPTQTTIDALATLLDEGDRIVDGGNTNWHDDVRRAAALHERGIHYVDVGVSGGVWGLEVGYCMMVGGFPESVERLAPTTRARPAPPSPPPRAPPSTRSGPRTPRSVHGDPRPAPRCPL